MSRERFEQQGEPSWRQLEKLASDAEGDRAEQRLAELPRLFRRVCHDLALAEHRGYGTRIGRRLNALALLVHGRVYGQRDAGRARLRHFLLAEFPRAVRREWLLVLWASLLLFGLGGLVFALALRRPELVYAIVDAPTLESIEKMYAPNARLPDASWSAGRFAAFGFYVQHNVGIAFQCYAGGAVLGLGALFALVFNGLYLGAIFGHVANVGLGQQLYTFVIAHGAFELTAIALAGAAGLMLCRAILAPGRRTRAAAFAHEGRQSVVLIGGAGGMLVVAALLEAFWSPAPGVAKELKYSVGASLWVLVLTWLAAAGRGGDGPRAN